jgi:hypothetical protein
VEFIFCCGFYFAVKYLKNAPTKAIIILGYGAGDRFSQRTFHWPLSGKPGAFRFGEPLVAPELPGEGESHPVAIIAVA